MPQVRNLPMYPVYEETVTPQQYIHLYETERDDIAHVEIALPQLGVPGFGGIIIRHRNPIYRLLSGRTNGTPKQSATAR